MIALEIAKELLQETVTFRKERCVSSHAMGQVCTQLPATHVNIGENAL